MSGADSSRRHLRCEPARRAKSLRRPNTPQISSGSWYTSGYTYQSIRLKRLLVTFQLYRQTRLQNVCFVFFVKDAALRRMMKNLDTRLGKVFKSLPECTLSVVLLLAQNRSLSNPFFFFLETKSFLLIPLPPFFSLLSAHNPPSPGLCLLEIKREKSSQALTWQNVRYHGHPLPVSNKLILKNGNEIVTIFKTHERIELWYRSGKNKSESTFDGTRRMIGGGGGCTFWWTSPMKLQPSHVTALPGWN